MQVPPDASVAVDVILGGCCGECVLKSAQPLVVTLRAINEAVTVSDFCGRLAARFGDEHQVNRLTLLFGEDPADRVHIMATRTAAIVEWGAWVVSSRGRWREAPPSFFPPRQGSLSALHLGVGRPEIKAIVCTCGCSALKEDDGKWRAGVHDYLRQGHTGV